MNDLDLEIFMHKYRYPQIISFQIRFVNRQISQCIHHNDWESIRQIMTQSCGISYDGVSESCLLSSLSFVYFSMYMEYIRRETRIFLNT